MPQITTNDLKTGITLDLTDGLFNVVTFQHVKPGKGGAFVRTKLKNVRTGAVLDRTFRAGEKVEQAIVETREMQYLYNDGDSYVFMDQVTFEQLDVPATSLGDIPDYLLPEMTPALSFYGIEIVGAELPASVELTITEVEPGVQGNRVSGATKPATLETGKIVKVPLFVNNGDKIKVDTRSGEYMTRV
ncbi:MAG: elongation factor P [Actinomycetota bacterium]|nr:elongation factor P [Actinomycetota bacterium]